MVTAHRKGWSVEHEAEKVLKLLGFELASKTKASLGPFDVLAEIKPENRTHDITAVLPVTRQELHNNNFIGVQAKFLREYMSKQEALNCINDAKKRKIIPLVAHKILIRVGGKRRMLFWERAENFLNRLNSVANEQLYLELKGRL